MSFVEQIMSNDKINIRAYFYYPIFFTTRTVLKIGNILSRIFLNFSWGILNHVMRLDQSRASETI